MAINVSVQSNGRLYTVDPMLFPSGNPFRCHVEVSLLDFFNPCIVINVI